MADALEELVISQLAKLGLQNDEDSTAFIIGIAKEDSFETDDKKSAILGMLEAEDDEVTAAKVDELLEHTSAHHEAELAKLQEEEDRKAAAAKELEDMKARKKVLTPEEEALRKAELLKQYSLVEEDLDEPVVEQKKKGEEEDKPFVDPRTLSKKARKKAEQGVDILMLPNQNLSNVKNAEAQQRKESAAAAAAKRDKDKSDLQRQKDMAAKKLKEKQAKAAKHERKG